jgi:hypothetical protein
MLKTTKNLLASLRRKKIFLNKGLMHSKEPAFQHGFNAAIDKLSEAEIISEMCDK